MPLNQTRTFKNAQVTYAMLMNAGISEAQFKAIYDGIDPDVQRFVQLAKGECRTPPAAAHLREKTLRFKYDSTTTPSYMQVALIARRLVHL
jgi:hypothetical protein